MSFYFSVLSLKAETFHIISSETSGKKRKRNREGKEEKKILIMVSIYSMLSMCQAPSDLYVFSDLILKQTHFADKKTEARKK